MKQHKLNAVGERQKDGHKNQKPPARADAVRPDKNIAGRRLRPSQTGLAVN
jgi:hypothetical protein